MTLINTEIHTDIRLNDIRFLKCRTFTNIEKSEKKLEYEENTSLPLQSHLLPGLNALQILLDGRQELLSVHQAVAVLVRAAKHGFHRVAARAQRQGSVGVELQPGAHFGQIDASVTVRVQQIKDLHSKQQNKVSD